MANLEITEARAAQMDKIEETSLNLLQAYLEGKRAGGDDIVTARCLLNVIKGNRQTQTAREALRFNMASAITKDRNALKKYVQATEPKIKHLLAGK